MWHCSALTCLLHTSWILKMLSELVFRAYIIISLGSDFIHNCARWVEQTLIPTESLHQECSTWFRKPWGEKHRYDQISNGNIYHHITCTRWDTVVPTGTDDLMGFDITTPTKIQSCCFIMISFDPSLFLLIIILYDIIKAALMTPPLSNYLTAVWANCFCWKVS